MYVLNVVGVCLKHFMSTGNKSVSERAKSSNILAGKKFFHREKGWNKYRRQYTKKEKKVQNKLFCFTDSNVYNYSVLLVFGYKWNAEIFSLLTTSLKFFTFLFFLIKTNL